MGNVNVFKTIRNVTSRIEPFHSQFLADALSDSLAGNRALFDAFWRLAAPSGWAVPAQAEITSEDVLGDRSRIDFCIHSRSAAQVLGVEVKTTDSSANDGQLGRYLEGLREKYGDCAIAVAYLTPFNRERAGELGEQLETIKAFEGFSGEFPEARHVSWLDVAEIDWGYGNELWQQHRSYVTSCIASYRKLMERSKRDRSFNVFFGDAAADVFWERLKALGIESSPGAGARVPVAVVCDVDAFVGAFNELIQNGEGVQRQPRQGRTGCLGPPRAQWLALDEAPHGGADIVRGLGLASVLEDSPPTPSRNPAAAMDE